MAPGNRGSLVARKAANQFNQGPVRYNMAGRN